MKIEKDNDHRVIHESGITYFTKRTERRVLFFLTMVMLIWGIVESAKDFF